MVIFQCVWSRTCPGLFMHFFERPGLWEASENSMAAGPGPPKFPETHTCTSDAFRTVSSMEMVCLQMLSNANFFFFQKCLEKDPTKRLTCQQLLQHSYFDGFDFKLPQAEVEEFERMKRVSSVSLSHQLLRAHALVVQTMLCSFLWKIGRRLYERYHIWTFLFARNLTSNLKSRHPSFVHDVTTSTASDTVTSAPLQRVSLPLSTNASKIIVSTYRQQHSRSQPTHAYLIVNNTGFCCKKYCRTSLPKLTFVKEMQSHHECISNHEILLQQ